MERRRQDRDFNLQNKIHEEGHDTLFCCSWRETKKLSKTRRSNIERNQQKTSDRETTQSPIISLFCFVSRFSCPFTARFCFFQRQPSVLIFIFSSQVDQRVMHFISFLISLDSWETNVSLLVLSERQREVLLKKRIQTAYIFSQKRTQRDRQNGGCFSPLKTDDVAWCVSLFMIHSQRKDTECSNQVTNDESSSVSFLVFLFRKEIGMMSKKQSSYFTWLTRRKSADYF